MLHLGAAHFGDINFDLSGLSGSKDNCTCALCQRKSAHHQLKVSLPLAEDTSDARVFGRHPLQHYFCTTADTDLPHVDAAGRSPEFDFGLSATR